MTHRILIARFAAAAVAAAAVSAPAAASARSLAASDAAFPVSVDGAASVPGAWRGSIAPSSASVAARETGASTLSLRRMRYGAFAEGRFDPNPEWAAASVLEIRLRVENHGIFSAKLVETDAAGRDGWVVSANLEPGVHTLRYRLAATAEGGDLVPAAPTGDGAWNPGADGVGTLRLGFSGGAVEVESVRLTR